VNKAIFRYWVDGPIIAIEDTGQGLSLPVTLDAERVLQTIDEAIGPLVGKHVIYADRDGVWDGITYSDDRLLIYHLGVASYPEAKKKLCSLPQTMQEQYRFKEDLPQGNYLHDWSPDV
jgi:hypothetical protein